MVLCLMAVAKPGEDEAIPALCEKGEDMFCLEHGYILALL